METNTSAMSTNAAAFTVDYLLADRNPASSTCPRNRGNFSLKVEDDPQYNQSPLDLSMTVDDSNTSSNSHASGKYRKPEIDKTSISNQT